MTTRLQFIQRAQARIGDEPITSETDAGAETHIAIFESVRDDLLSRYPWTFASVVTRRSRLQVGPPPGGYKYYYQMPSDMLGAPRAVYAGSDFRYPITAYQLTENRIASDAEQIWLSYTKRADPAFWPGYFLELMSIVVRSEMALSIREDPTLYDRLRLSAFGTPGQMGEGGLFGQAKNIDAQASPSPVVLQGSSPLVDVRFSNSFDHRTFTG